MRRNRTYLFLLVLALTLVACNCGGGGGDGKKHTFKAKLDTTKFKVVDTSTMGRLLRVVLPERAYADDPALEDVTEIWAIPLKKDPDPTYGIAMSLKNIQDKKEVTIDTQGNFVLDISAMAQIADSMLLVLVDARDETDRSERFKGIVGIKSVNDESLVQIPLEKVSGSIDAGLVTESTVEEHVAETEADTGDVAPSLGVPTSLLDEQAQMDNATKSVRTLIANYDQGYNVTVSYTWNNGVSSGDQPSSITIKVYALPGIMGIPNDSTDSRWIMPDGSDVTGEIFRTKATVGGTYDTTAISSDQDPLILDHLNAPNYGTLMLGTTELCYFDAGYTGLFTSTKRAKIIPVIYRDATGYYLLFKIDRVDTGTYDEYLTESEFDALPQYTRNIHLVIATPCEAWSFEGSIPVMERVTVLGYPAYKRTTTVIEPRVQVTMEHVGRTFTKMHWDGIPVVEDL